MITNIQQKSLLLSVLNSIPSNNTKSPTPTLKPSTPTPAQVPKAPKTTAEQNHIDLVMMLSMMTKDINEKIEKISERVDNIANANCPKPNFGNFGNFDYNEDTAMVDDYDRITEERWKELHPEPTTEEQPWFPTKDTAFHYFHSCLIDRKLVEPLTDTDTYNDLFKQMSWIFNQNVWSHNEVMNDVKFDTLADQLNTHRKKSKLVKINETVETKNIMPITVSSTTPTPAPV
jgi:hypothetical protein